MCSHLEDDTLRWHIFHGTLEQFTIIALLADESRFRGKLEDKERPWLMYVVRQDVLHDLPGRLRDELYFIASAAAICSATSHFHCDRANSPMI